MSKLIIANWKMQLDYKAALALVKDYKKEIKKTKNTVVACPDFLVLSDAATAWKKSRIALGAQDAFWEKQGAYTGEVSPKGLKQLGCEYVILGHSERREHLKESCRLVNQKAKAALAEGLTPVICVGESTDKRNTGKHKTFVAGQVKRALSGIKLGGSKLVIAYEPLWAIGSGKVIKPGDAREMHEHIYEILKKTFGQTKLDQVKVLYGGSVDDKNAIALSAMPNIDGFLVGGASLKPKKFAKIASV